MSKIRYSLSSCINNRRTTTCIARNNAAHGPSSGHIKDQVRRSRVLQFVDHAPSVSCFSFDLEARSLSVEPTVTILPVLVSTWR